MRIGGNGVATPWNFSEGANGPLYFAERSGGTDGTLCFWLKTQLCASYEIDTLCIV